MNDKRYIQQLVQRFLDGETTLAEEQELYARFASGNVPHSLRRYTEMFAWYAGGMDETKLPAMPARRRAPALRWMVRVAAAAGICAFFAVGAAGILKYQERKDLYARYEGSFIVRDGKKITDIAKILPELQQVERETREEEEALRRQIEQADEADAATDWNNDASWGTPTGTTL